MGKSSMTAEVSTASISPADDADLARRRLSIGFMNWAHALDHFVILIYPTVVIELQAAYGQSYSTLIAQIWFQPKFEPLEEDA